MPPPALDRLAHGLRGHVNRFAHVVINVSDLERAVDFYEATFRYAAVSASAHRHSATRVSASSVGALMPG